MYEVGFLVVLVVDGIHGITGQQCLFRLFTDHFENRVKIDIDNLILYTHTQSLPYTLDPGRETEQERDQGGVGLRPSCVMFFQACWSPLGPSLLSASGGV